ncbi:Xaa-Pro dipeptidase [Microbulbifer sp. CAU 1566]|uniref:Xaa-Pro dipeptidase n=1 Tax=Microbulbifer sp. CAU 1566 TaxID=2933269 RepID=UPI002004A3AB|nr:Xaa-Pro dipeptidase [Microbulbifer sp. CAU 1566]MCK7596715.1 Xaa-Pro dipeptidase [Microbulbifer sp. CAU 1566]
MSLANLYQLHIEEIIRRHSRAMAFHGFSRLVIYSGTPKLPFLDDNHYTFKVNPHFKHWVPLLEHPHCAIDFRPGEKPRLIYFQPEDYWHKPPADPEGYWVDAFDIELATSFDDVISALAGDTEGCALIGEDSTCFPQLPKSQSNPSGLIDELHYHRAYKTSYEAECLRRANRLSAAGHLAAKDAFMGGATELGIHHAYLAGAGVLEAELPYGNIVAVNSHSSVLHYHGADREKMSPADIHSLVIDAGADYLGYASDITRSYAFRSGDYAKLLEALDTAQQTLVSEVAIGQNFADLHWRAHYLIACILRDFDFVMMSPKDMVVEGITNVFFPCGLGHFIGLQVHDVGGYLMAPRERPRLRDPRAPYLRNARNIEAGQALTIEPGIYFMDMLLGELSRSKHSYRVNWEKVDAFKKYGGVRVEDCILVHEDRVENQSRDAFAALAREAGVNALKVTAIEPVG